MSNLMIPKRVAAAETMRRAKMKAQADNVPAPPKGMGFAAAKPKHEIETDDFLTPEEVGAQVTSFIEHVKAGGTVPRPVGWRVAVLILTIPEVSAGGVIMVDDHREARSLASPQGIVIGVGPTAYADKARFADGKPWVQIGDRVLFQKYGGRMFQLRSGQHTAILNDTEFAAVVDGGWLEQEDVE